MRPNYTLPRLYLDRDLADEFDVSREQAHYFGTVLRKREGDRVRLFNAKDGEWAAEIIDTGRKTMRLRVVEQLREPIRVPDIRLLFAPIRKHRTATLLEKCTELGVRTFQPVITDRTQYPKLNIDRAMAQIVEAAEQTERLDLPDIYEPVALMDMWPSDRPLLFADEAGDAPNVLTALSSVALPLDILIGPEGGFSPDEREAIRALPIAIPVSLGARILRADTAAISLLTLVQAHLGDWQQI